MKRKLYKLESLAFPDLHSLLRNIFARHWLRRVGKSQRFLYFTSSNWGSRVGRVSKGRL